MQSSVNLKLGSFSIIHTSAVLMSADVIENDHNFEWTEDCATVSLKWTDLRLFIICKWLGNSKGFQCHLKKIFCGCYMKKNVAFTLISFALLKWDDCLSIQVSFELLGSDIVSVAFRARCKLTISKCEWTRIWTI